MTDERDPLTDPALSAAVALAMGWQRGNDIDGNDIWVTPDGSALSADRWRPHTDHNDLHRVIEWMRERGWHVDALMFSDGRTVGNVFPSRAGLGDSGYAESDCINTAVLRACLEAVRSEKP